MFLFLLLSCYVAATRLHAWNVTDIFYAHCLFGISIVVFVCTHLLFRTLMAVSMDTIMDDGGVNVFVLIEFLAGKRIGLG